MMFNSAQGVWVLSNCSLWLLSLLPNSKISQDQATSQRGVGKSKNGFGLVRNNKEAHQQPQKQQHATEGVVGYKYSDFPKTSRYRSSENRCHRFPKPVPPRFKQLAVETADIKPFPPVFKNRCHRVCSDKPKKCVHVAFVSLNNSHGLLEHWDIVKTPCDASLLIVRHSYTQDQI